MTASKRVGERRALGKRDELVQEAKEAQKRARSSLLKRMGARGAFGRVSFGVRDHLEGGVWGNGTLASQAVQLRDGPVADAAAGC